MRALTRCLSFKRKAALTRRHTAYVYGASGHGKAVGEAILAGARFTLAGFVDDDPAKKEQRVLGHRVVGSLSDLRVLAPHAWLALGVGDNRKRMALMEALVSQGWRLATVVHPSAVIASTASLGIGSYVGPTAVVHADASMGACCIVNSGAVIEHDNCLGDAVHVSPNATLGGQVTVGKGTHIGLGAVILPRMAVGEWATVGAGAVVTRRVPDSVVVTGIPARVQAQPR